MATRTQSKPTGNDWLDEIRNERRKKKNRKRGQPALTSRELYGYGLLAGLTYTEMRDELTPGFILDMYMARIKHDKIFSAIGLFGGGGDD